MTETRNNQTKGKKYICSLLVAVLYIFLMGNNAIAQQANTFEKEEEKKGYFNNERIRVGASLSLLSSQPQSNDFGVMASNSLNGQFQLNADYFLIDKKLAISSGVGLRRMNLKYETVDVKTAGLQANLITCSQSTHLVVPVMLKYRSPLIGANMKVYAAAGVNFINTLHSDAFLVSKKGEIQTQPRRTEVLLAKNNLEQEIRLGAEFMLAKSLMSDFSISYRRDSKSLLADQNMNLKTVGINFGIFF